MPVVTLTFVPEAEALGAALVVALSSVVVEGGLAAGGAGVLLGGGATALVEGSGALVEGALVEGKGAEVVGGAALVADVDGSWANAGAAASATAAAAANARRWFIGKVLP
jgi:hypothetical protein